MQFQATHLLLVNIQPFTSINARTLQAEDLGDLEFHAQNIVAQDIVTIDFDGMRKTNAPSY
ncbi:MAG: hypothetical protein EDM05_020455 [Leptolyngbya sp. IPPAS B-1204]|uniref:Uncharacterized protein n=1 Tax=Leptolyngbya sp. NK1-12 TaxID=2547451 RepID=A0AA96WDC9_9CYAN|nr:hypothetical protein [Leptolyngbya sp. NK1-12]RNJ64913.1 MAG: hypothetical protein EDM05_33950 [Leptolyngbya sp. IPPAS B-1204]WNZ22475.1 hypothetical protein HJG54_06100 [Leptolyngbya sp. NK1-12]